MRPQRDLKSELFEYKEIDSLESGKRSVCDPSHAEVSLFSSLFNNGFLPVVESVNSTAAVDNYMEQYLTWNSSNFGRIPEDFSASNFELLPLRGSTGDVILADGHLGRSVAESAGFVLNTLHKPFHLDGRTLSLNLIPVSERLVSPSFKFKVRMAEQLPSETVDFACSSQLQLVVR